MTELPAFTHSAKPNLRRETLESHGIFYIESPLFNTTRLPIRAGGTDSHPTFVRLFKYLLKKGINSSGVIGEGRPSLTFDGQWELPRHVDWLREVLLNVRRSLPGYAAAMFLSNEERSEIPKEVLSDDDDHKFLSGLEKSIREERLRIMLAECRETARQACGNLQNGISEHDWQYFMERWIFKRLQEGGNAMFGEMSNDALFDSYAMRSNIQWNGAHNNQDLDGTSVGLTGPKPDIFFGFPILRRSMGPTYGLQGSSLVYNFSCTKLTMLTQKGLVSSPTKGLKRQARAALRNLRHDDLVCFPFAVVELKHGEAGSREEFCYCQAANGASTALRMLENLYRHADGQNNDNHVPPVVAFTCIGPVIRLWIAYTLREPNGAKAHLMVCVWQSPMTSTWAVLEMQIILKNLLRWATRVLKPSISSNISRWRVRKDDIGSVDQMCERRPLQRRNVLERRPVQRKAL